MDLAGLVMSCGRSSADRDMGKRVTVTTAVSCAQGPATSVNNQCSHAATTTRSHPQPHGVGACVRDGSSSHLVGQRHILHLAQL